MKNLFSALVGSPWFLYFKLGLVAAAVAGSAYLAWDYRGAIAERETQTAVNTAVTTAVKVIQKDLDTERAFRTFYQGLADEKYEKLMKSFANIRVEHRTIQNNIYQEIEKNPEFYKLPLPPGGYEEWKKARALSQGLPAQSAPSQ